MKSRIWDWGITVLFYNFDDLGISFFACDLDTAKGI
jgi:hypothetical protein